MYGNATEEHKQYNLVKNEIAFQNLINVACNPRLFDALDEGTKKDLVDVIALYTKGSIEKIKNPDTSKEAKYISKHLK